MRCQLRVPAGCIRAEGMIKNVNTVEDFRTTDYTTMLTTAGKQVASSDGLKDFTANCHPDLGCH
jgi:ubiquitin-like modifier-activating enzyme ATG7